MNKTIKCLVWDLDNTLWEGILTENDSIKLKPEVEKIIKALDERGILQSIASKNNYDESIKMLEEFGLDKYFIYPQINWNPKSNSIKKIAEKINIAIDSIAFIDDQQFELQEVNFSCPEVLTIDANEYLSILDRTEFTPRFITEDSKRRRLMYLNDIQRKKEEESFQGNNEEFLETLNMKLKISRVKIEDLQRVEELTIRTHQLNSTGYTYSYEELTNFIESKNHVFITAGLNDKFGDYGKVGLGLLEINEDKYIIKLLLMSCRVMTKGIGTAMLVYLIKLAKENNKRLLAEFLHTDRNRVMYITYKFMGFEEIEENGEKVLLEYVSQKKHEYPSYLEVE